MNNVIIIILIVIILIILITGIIIYLFILKNNNLNDNLDEVNTYNICNTPKEYSKKDFRELYKFTDDDLILF